MSSHARTLTGLLALVLVLPLVGAAAPDEATGAEDPGGPYEVTIVRDGYGVPHVYADTRDAVAYGVGYALAQDRLWQMHTFRHIAKGELSDILGPVVLDIDRTVRFYTYTEEERERRFQRMPDDVRSGLTAFVAGINAWIDEAQSDPSKMPFEFVEYGEVPIDAWTVTDSVALQDVLILSFGAGGGNEIAYAALAERLRDRFGAEDGLAAFDDLVRTLDPDMTPTIPEDLDWRSTPTYAREDEAESRRALTPDARISLLADGGSDVSASGVVTRALGGSTLTGGAVGTSDGSVRSDVVSAAVGTAAQLELIPDAQKAFEQFEPLRRALDALQAMFSFGSNAQIVGPALTETGNAAQTGGPQVGYMVPQWLADFGMHGGGLSATGMTFAGAGPAVLIGRGPGYAWTTTTGSSDLSDTYVEELHPDDPRRYRYQGEWEQMECREETYTFRGVPFESEEICRTRHGPVVAWDEDNGVAYAVRNAWFDREEQTVEGFWRYNEVASLEDFATYASYLASNHNMFYTDDRGHFGYWTPGNHPVRAEGIDLRLPQDGRGGSEWQGLRPIQDVPHAVDFERAWLVNWNNAPSADWERERAYTARDNVDSLERAYRDTSVPDPAGGVVNGDGLWGFEALSANLRYGAMSYHDHAWYRSTLDAIAGHVEGDRARQALDHVRSWDGFRLDDDGDGEFDHSGITIVDRWLRELHAATFGEALGGDAGWARRHTELWQLFSPESSAEFSFDWLGDRDPNAVTAEAFERAVAALAEAHDSDDPAAWRSGAWIQRYQRLNADLVGDLLRTQVCNAGICEGPIDRRSDSGMPGDVPEHIYMDRGTYNHVVVYTEPPAGPGKGKGAGTPKRRGHGGASPAQTPLGLSPARAGSVIPPGQSGFIDLAGRESRHFEDQLPLYTGWDYKPMPLSIDRARELSSSEETIVYDPGS